MMARVRFGLLPILDDIKQSRMYSSFPPYIPCHCISHTIVYTPFLMIRALLKEGADLEKKCNNGKKPMDVALNYQSKQALAKESKNCIVSHLMNSHTI